MPSVTYVSLCGLLGYGFPKASLDAAMQHRPAFIGVDAGSTDPGPYYLGNGKNFVHPSQVRRDLTLALLAARKSGAKLIIGTAGGAGAKPHLEHFLELLREIATKHDLHFRLAYIPAEIDKSLVHDALSSGKISPCGHAGKLTTEAIDSSRRIVGQMGTAPLIRAIETGADVIVAGRCCDTAIFAALPISQGLDAALSLHGAKIAECGTLCARPAAASDCLICTINEDSFHVVPANPERRCTPESVAAHSLYEQPDPHRFHEPEGTVDLSESEFTADGGRGVNVSGTRLFSPTKQTVKLEGAAFRGCRAVTIAGTCDPQVIANLDTIEQSVRESIANSLPSEEFSLRFLRYGLDAVSLAPCSADLVPHEVGVLIDVVAPTRELADAVLSLARSSALHQHFAGRKTTAGNLAFPFSPSDLQAGDVWEFSVYHLMEVDDDKALFPVHMEDI